jgi:hypothetical protein
MSHPASTILFQNVPVTLTNTPQRSSDQKLPLDTLVSGLQTIAAQNDSFIRINFEQPVSWEGIQISPPSGRRSEPEVAYKLGGNAAETTVQTEIVVRPNMMSRSPQEANAYAQQARAEIQNFLETPSPRQTAANFNRFA